MQSFNLEELYSEPQRIVITAHRGFSGQFPENTLPAFEQAIKLNADVIEFDVRGTKENIPVVLHDSTLDRTSDGSGSPNQYTLAELRQMNFSYWKGPHNTGYRLESPELDGVTIPTLHEVLELGKGKVGFNIQVYETTSPLLENICDIYSRFDLYEDGYLSMSTYREAELVRRINPKIELCVLERARAASYETLLEEKAFGLKFTQPARSAVTPEFCRWIREAGLLANMFYSNTDEDNRRFISYGIQGILTDCLDIMYMTLKSLGMNR